MSSGNARKQPRWKRYIYDGKYQNRTLDIDVEIIDKQQLLAKAIEHYNSRRISQKRISRDEIARITVNYIRHHLTKYDLRSRSDLRNETKKQAAMKRLVLRKIAAAYPWLADECARQEQISRAGVATDGLLRRDRRPQRTILK